VLLTPSWKVPFDPAVNAPTAVSVMERSACARIVVESVVFAPADPPPDTLTLFTCGVAAETKTFTVTVIAG
jgi:hypothetical protein